MSLPFFCKYPSSETPTHLLIFPSLKLILSLHSNYCPSGPIHFQIKVLLATLSHSLPNYHLLGEPDFSLITTSNTINNQSIVHTVIVYGCCCFNSCNFCYMFHNINVAEIDNVCQAAVGRLSRLTFEAMGGGEWVMVWWVKT